MANVTVVAPKTEPIAKALIPVLRGAEGLAVPIGIGVIVGLLIPKMVFDSIVRRSNGRQRRS